MKKYIISISIIIISCITALIIAFSTKNSKIELSLTSPDNEVTINLGKYRCKDYNKDYYDGDYMYITFYVDSPNDIYNLISSSKYYRSDLEFIVDDYFVYGFLVEKEHFFLYYIENNFVKILSFQGMFVVDQDSYFISLPVKPSLSKESLEENENTGGKYYRSLLMNEITFDMLLSMLNYVNEDSYIVDLENKIIGLKGLSSIDLLDSRIVYSDNYLIKVYISNGNVIVGVYD